MSGLFGVSAFYHCGTWSAAAARSWQRLDHVMFFVLIASSATPIYLLGTPAPFGAICLLVTWIVTITAIVVHVFWMHAPEALVGGVFIGLGSSAGVALPAIWLREGPLPALLILVGGVLYATGAVLSTTGDPIRGRRCSATTRSSTPSCARRRSATSSRSPGSCADRGRRVRTVDLVPEGDSVWLVARKLDTALKGRPLVRGQLRVAAHATADLAGATVLENDTHGKHLLTRLDNGDTLHTHLRMQGSWSVVRAGRRLPRHVWPDVRVVLGVEEGPTAHGISLPVVDLLRTSDEATVIGHLGPDPLRADWDAAEAARRMTADPTRTVAAVLLDQRAVAGFGNLWVNELCFLRGHSPWTPIGEVDVGRLLTLGARTLRHSAHVPAAYQVTTGSARRGESHWVAGRAGRPCLRCRTIVRVVDEVRDDPEQRRTWWCPSCQPGPSP